ncbi:Isoflavone reductase-like protein A622-like protein 1 [Colletotrichum chlorophyti]|uniref:Isoflavone reductase-like protein A622-like protein 1 n=1 Tax=Colletotrichum chlorophyti TaxID=708187 RepID=A0A1Q8RGH7_9PEZI|nr:Isoflavone reductase-like protein A622-like protein 1 [Colletotrichum chlorophyti]
MSTNRIAVYGHRGWAGSRIVDGLIASGAPITVLYRPGSDVSRFPESVSKIEVDVADEESLIRALEDADIVISLVGHDGIETQHDFIKAIPKTNVKLFSPSKLAAAYDEQGLRIPLNKAKKEVEQLAKATGVPTTVVQLGNFAEFALNTPAMGVDVSGNRLVHSGNSSEERLNLCTRKYVAAAYASIFPSTPIALLGNRVITISELTPTGNDVAAALQAKYGVAPKITVHSMEKVNAEVEEGLKVGSPFTLSWYCRKIWGTGQVSRMVGNDVWDVKGYEKATLRDLIVDSKLDTYRELPPEFTKYLLDTFQ